MMTFRICTLLCLALAVVTVIRCDDQSSNVNDDDSPRVGNIDEETSDACDVIRRFITSDITARPKQSRLLRRYFTDFDTRRFLLRLLPRIIVTNDFTFKMPFLRGNLNKFLSLMRAPEVESLLGDLRLDFEALLVSIDSLNETDTEILQGKVTRLRDIFQNAVDSCEFPFGNRRIKKIRGKIRNLFNINIFSSLLATSQCNFGDANFDDVVANANATAGEKPTIFKIIEIFADITPFIVVEDYVDLYVTAVLRPIFYPFANRTEAEIAVNQLFVTFVDANAICGGDPFPPEVIELFDYFYNVELLEYVVAKHGLTANEVSR